MKKLTECPICSNTAFLRRQGFDYKPGPKVYEYLGLPGTKSSWSICQACGFLFQNPRPSPERILSLYQSGLYRQERDYGEKFFHSRYEIPLRHLKWMLSETSTLPNHNILDIGAGFGGAVKSLMDQGYNVDGVELDQNLCAEAWNRFRVKLINSDIMGCDFPPDSFGVIYSAHVHEHFDDFESVNKKLVSWLIPGGYLLCIVPTYRYAAKNGQGFINVFHNSIFTHKSLKNMFLKCGLEPIAFRYPHEHSNAEIWGLGRLPLLKQNNESNDPDLIMDNWRFVAQEVKYSPALFETMYRLLKPISRLRQLLLNR